MNIIEKFFNTSEKHFSDKGKLKALKPLFKAAETFFLIPGIEAKKTPYVRDSLDLKRYMTIVIVALLPCLFFGIYNAGYQSNALSNLDLGFIAVFIKGLEIVMPLIIVSYATGFFWETLFASIRKHSISEGFLVTGLLLPLTLPPTVPLWQVVMGVSFGVVIGKEVFGGTGRNIFNPALTGRAFMFFAYPSKMSGDAVWFFVDNTAKKAVDAVSGATPLSCSSMTEYFNLSNLKPLDMFWGNYTGCIGETSTFACLIGAIILIVTGIASYRIILGGVIGLLSTGLLTVFLTDSINPFYHLILGGFAFGIVFMATDPVSSPGMDKAKWIYGFMIGALTILIRVFNPAYAEGVMLTILFMNMFAPLLDYIEIKIKLSKRIPNVG